MASSSKRSRAASTKKSSTGRARRISVRRTDVLPRTGTTSAGRCKPGAEPPVDSSTEALAKPVARSKKKAHRPKQTENVTSRTKARRPAGRTSAKPKRPAAKAVTPTAPAPVPMTVDLQPVAEPLGAAEPTVLDAPAVTAPAVLETELVVEASAILEETTIATAFAPPPHPRKRALTGAISRLLATLRRWTVAR